MDYSVVLASIVVFLIITFLLVGMLLGAKAKLLPSGPVSLMINGDNKVEVSSGSTLLNTWGIIKYFYPQPVVVVELVFNVSVKYLKVEEKFFLLKLHTFLEKKLLKDGV